MYSHSVFMGWVSKLLLSHQTKRRKLRCSCLTLTWWNITECRTWRPPVPGGICIAPLLDCWLGQALEGDVGWGILLRIPRYSHRQSLFSQVSWYGIPHGEGYIIRGHFSLRSHLGELFCMTLTDDVTHECEVIISVLAISLQSILQLHETFQGYFFVAGHYKQVLFEREGHLIMAIRSLMDIPQRLLNAKFLSS